MKKLFISLVIALSSVVSFASNIENSDESNTSKLSEMVANADANDWATYTKAASLAINWNADLELAKEWIDTAISIDENAENLEVLGDYYVRLGNTEKALETYMKALSTDITTIEKDLRDSIQRKVLVYGRK
ncbi:M48 family metallopeptidase [Flammeovirga sp. SJP92]|uniref:tetratricopeptide repeat protein n=1 Tax=Flammeovirga sp. SJP92 TaxID=1775430 RepID=UPI000786A60D|nr:hypothetical protein [Flammeovirga sp. SJP92]KXX70732.1 hypothetical protein AVL50_07920 [Flammeovirga sp. SJP92]